MKTLKFAALAAVGLALPALAGSSGIQSANIVGYQTMKLESDNFTMFAVPFIHVNDKIGLMLNSDLTFANATASAEDDSAADQIWIWVPGREAYDKFFLYAGEGEWKAGWCSVLGNWNYFEEMPGYKDEGLPEGAALYYKAKKGVSKSVTGAGAVIGEDDVELFLAGGAYTMIANPYPVATKLNAETCVKFDNNTKATDDGNPNTADQIWIWVPSTGTYDKFFCSKSGVWTSFAGDEFDDVYPDGIASGSAFYYKAKSAGEVKVTFINPVKSVK